MIEEVPIDFNTVEDFTFTCGDSLRSFHNFFRLSKDVSEKSRGRDIAVTAEQLKAAVLTICGTEKQISFFGRGNVADEVRQLVEKSVKESLPPADDTSTDSTQPQKCYVTILDRSFDPLAPLMHSYGYQAAIYDNLEVEGDKLTWTTQVDYATPPDQWSGREVINWLNDHRFFNCHGKLKKPDGKKLLDMDAKVVADAFPDEAEKELFIAAVNRLKLSLISSWSADRVSQLFTAQGCVSLAETLGNPSGADVLKVTDATLQGLSNAERGCIDNIRRAQKDEIRKEMKLSEKDDFFQANRYNTFIETNENYHKKFDEYKNGLYGKFQRKELSEREHRQFMRHYKELSAEKKIIEQHVQILDKIFSQAGKLKDLLDLEFSVATGYEDDKTDVLNKHRKMQKPQAIPRVAKMIGGEHKLTDLEKVRLLYILFCSHGFLSDPERATLFRQGGMGLSAQEDMRKLEKLGVNPATGIDKQREEFHVVKKANTKKCIDNGDRERYSPLVRWFVLNESKELKNRGVRKERIEKIRVEYEIIQKMDLTVDDPKDKAVRYDNYHQMWTTLENSTEKVIKKSFASLAQNGIITWETFRDTMLEQMDHYTGKHIPIGTVTSAQQTQQKKTRKWGKKSKEKARASEADNGVAPWIIFFVGGVAYNEIREIRRISLQSGQPIYVGATELLDASSYVSKFDSGACV